MTKIIIAIVIVVAVIGGYFAFKKAPGATNSPVENETAENSATTEKKMAFSQFVKQGGSYKCTVNQYIDGMGGSATQGTTYIDNGMIRGEYSMQAQGISVNSTFIVRDGYSYSWTSMAPTMGFKTKVVENSEVDTSVSASGNYSYNSEQIGDYDCEAWTSDVSKFSIPTSIIFKEV